MAVVQGGRQIEALTDQACRGDGAALPVVARIGFQAGAAARLGVDLDRAGGGAITKHHGATALGDFDALNVAERDRADELRDGVDVVEAAAIDRDHQVLEAVIAIAPHADLRGVAVAVAGADLQRGLLRQIVEQRMRARALDVAAGVHLGRIGRILVVHVDACGRDHDGLAEAGLGAGRGRQQGQGGSHSQGTGGRTEGHGHHSSGRDPASPQAAALRTWMHRVRGRGLLKAANMPHSSLPPRSASDSVRFGRSPGWCVGPVDRTCGTPSQDVVVPVAQVPQTRTYRCGGSTGIASIGGWRAPVSRLTQGVTDLGTDNVVTASWEAVDGDDTGLPARTGCVAQVPAALGRASRL